MADLAPRADVRVIRCSSLTSYPDCARRASADLFPEDIKAAGFELKRTPKSIAAHIGTAVHTAGAAMLEDKRDSGSWSTSAAIDAGIHALHKGSVQDGALYHDNVTRSMNDAERQVERMALTYAEHIVTKLDPISVEERLEADVAPGIILSGQKDNVGRTPRKLNDLKTGGKLRVYTPQVGGYSLLEKSHEMPVDEAAIHFIQRVSLNRDQPLPIEVTIDLVQAETAAIKIVDMIVRDLTTFRLGSPDGKIKPGDPWAFAANPNSGLCAANWCKAWGTAYCHEHMKEIA